MSELTVSERMGYEAGPVTKAERAEQRAREAEERVKALELGLGIMEQEMTKVEQQRDDLRAALEELVLLKQWKDEGAFENDYRTRKPLAWERAREVLNELRG